MMSNIPQHEEAYCHTKTSVNELKFYWSIDNFVPCCLQIRRYMRSDVFFLGPGDWRLGHYPNYTTPNSMRFTLDYLGQRAGANESKASNSIDYFSFHAELSLIASDGRTFEKIVNREVDVRVTKTFSKDFEFCKINLQEDLEKNIKNMGGKLSVVCHIIIFSSMEHEPLVYRSRLQQDFAPREAISKLLESGLHSDVVLSASGGQEFHVHKCILAALSSVFQAMFKHPLAESISNRVKMDDVNANVLEEMLRYIYNGQAYTIPREMAQELLFLADKYALEGLKAQCGELIFSDINAENACDMLIMADRCAENLKKLIANYIHNNAKAIKGSETGRKYISQRNLLVLEALAGISF